MHFLARYKPRKLLNPASVGLNYSLVAVCLLDCVEFNLSYDYRSSRWLAVSVKKVEPALTVSKEQFSGLVLIKAEPQEKFKVNILVMIHSHSLSTLLVIAELSRRPGCDV